MGCVGARNRFILLITPRHTGHFQYVLFSFTSSVREQECGLYDPNTYGSFSPSPLWLTKGVISSLCECGMRVLFTCPVSSDYRPYDTPTFGSFLTLLGKNRDIVLIAPRPTGHFYFPLPLRTGIMRLIASRHTGHSPLLRPYVP